MENCEPTDIQITTRAQSCTVTTNLQFQIVRTYVKSFLKSGKLYQTTSFPFGHLFTKQYKLVEERVKFVPSKTLARVIITQMHTNNMMHYAQTSEGNFHHKTEGIFQNLKLFDPKAQDYRQISLPVLPTIRRKESPALGYTTFQGILAMQ